MTDRPKTRDQRLYERDGRLKAEIDVDPETFEKEQDTPSVIECRFAAFQLNNKGKGYVVYDRLLSRIVNGVFYGAGSRAAALRVAHRYNTNPDSGQDMSPSGVALGLIYPTAEEEES